MDGVFCLAVSERERRRLTIVRLGVTMGVASRDREEIEEDMDEARPLIVSRTDDIDEPRAGIGAILSRTSAL